MSSVTESIVLLNWSCPLCVFIFLFFPPIFYGYFFSVEKATAECIADAIADNRAELVHLPSSMDLNMPLPSKDCPTCDGTVRLILPSMSIQVSKMFSPSLYIIIDIGSLNQILSGCNQFWFEMHIFTLQCSPFWYSSIKYAFYHSCDLSL
jgi:hypothetical protein